MGNPCRYPGPDAAVGSLASRWECARARSKHSVGNAFEHAVCFRDARFRGIEQFERRYLATAEQVDRLAGGQPGEFIGTHGREHSMQGG